MKLFDGKVTINIDVLMEKTTLKRFLCLCGMCTLLLFVRAQNRLDSIQQLDEVVVTAQTYKEVIPAQRLEGKELEGLSTHSIADALRYFSGVQIKDYGGVGGIKTVNIRSMGTNHMGVFYDDIQLGNAQNGQIDLGQYSLDNIEEISLFNGQKSNIFQSAKDFSSAGSIYIRTRKPRFDGNEQYHVKGNLRFGSFGVLNPSALIELKLTESLGLSLNTEWLKGNGKYKFRYQRVNPAGEIAYDTTAVRKNGDINATRIEVALYRDLHAGSWQLKAYNYNSERGIPGAIVNNVWRRGERTWDTNSFVQGQVEKSFSHRFKSQLKGKYAHYRTHYVNNDDKQIKVDNLYKQKELYISCSNLYTLLPDWDISLSYDFQWNNLDADMWGFVWPTRYTHLLSVATAFKWKRLKVQASGVGSFVNDKIREQVDPPKKRVFTPALFASLQPLQNPDFTLRAFCKKSFRMPTFNDLYYADMGNSKLEPETAIQYDFGLAYNKSFRHGFFREVKAQADAYYNQVRNKIIAYPKGQQFRWTMLNLGKVEIKGIDLSAQTTINVIDELMMTIRAQYTYQKAIDVTNPADNYYRHQIPYIPWHSGSAIVNLQYRGWLLNYSFIYVGERYNQQENIRYNHTQPWYTSDLSLTNRFRLGGQEMKASLEVNNLLSQDYDVILNYPMPKRNFRFTVSIEI